ncbi:MAG: RagB/SusD family nutrient uptake outer membrane protein [Niastella sp.]|uniref:RagB/SusD family nutrient uptake outer membrane protein n=1 Tax=Niastella sp. TaxID=1869183 RepID=UPI00389B15B1
MKYTVALLLIFLQACNKNDLLKEKQGTAIIVPETPGDMQALLDNEDVFGPTTSLNFICGDEFYFADTALSDLKQSIVNAYLHKDFLFDKEEEVSDWNNGYTQAYYANNVLEGVARLRGSIDDKILDPLEGDAWFKRSFAFFNVAQVFAPPYDSLTAADDQGIPLRLTIRQNEVLARSSVAATYKEIIDDLGKAIQLLPPTIELVHRNRSSRPAAYALLARVYLSMGAYNDALDAANRSLALYDSLINFNTGIVSSSTPFSATNAETLYQSTVSNTDALYEKIALREVFVDSTLLAEYKVGDLRRAVFFSRSSPATFKPGYYGKLTPFTGLAMAELYLIISECYARQGDVNTAMFYLNKLLKSRWKTGQYIPYTAATPEIALTIILLERRKELIFRGLRYTDVRRLNKKQPLLTLSRTMQGYTYVLLPNSWRYALPIPEQVLRFNNRIEQNKY